MTVQTTPNPPVQPAPAGTAPPPATAGGAAPAPGATPTDPNAKPKATAAQRVHRMPLGATVLAIFLLTAIAALVLFELFDPWVATAILAALVLLAIALLLLWLRNSRRPGRRNGGNLLDRILGRAPQSTGANSAGPRGAGGASAGAPRHRGGRMNPLNWGRRNGANPAGRGPGAAGGAPRHRGGRANPLNWGKSRNRPGGSSPTGGGRQHPGGRANPLNWGRKRDNKGGAAGSRPGGAGSWWNPSSWRRKNQPTGGGGPAAGPTGKSKPAATRPGGGSAPPASKTPSPNRWQWRRRPSAPGPAATKTPPTGGATPKSGGGSRPGPASGPSPTSSPRSATPRPSPRPSPARRPADPASPRPAEPPAGGTRSRRGPGGGWGGHIPSDRPHRGGGDMSGVKNNEGASLIKWGEGVRQAPQALEALAAHYRRLAEQSEDDHPIAPALREQFRAAAVRCQAAAEAAQGWYPTLRQQNAADFAAYEEPRDGSVHKESKTDTRRAWDEGI